MTIIINQHHCSAIGISQHHCMTMISLFRARVAQKPETCIGRPKLYTTTVYDRMPHVRKCLCYKHSAYSVIIYMRMVQPTLFVCVHTCTQSPCIHACMKLSRNVSNWCEILGGVMMMRSHYRGSPSNLVIFNGVQPAKRCLSLPCYASPITSSYQEPVPGQDCNPPDPRSFPPLSVKEFYGTRYQTSTFL